MRTRFWRLLILAAVAANGDLAAQPPEGSQLAPDENACVMCHGEKELWEGENLRLYMPADQFADDIHWQKGVNCHDCHGGDPTVFDPGDLQLAEPVLRKGVHAKAGDRKS